MQPFRVCLGTPTPEWHSPDRLNARRVDARGGTLLAAAAAAREISASHSPLPQLWHGTWPLRRWLSRMAGPDDCCRLRDHHLRRHHQSVHGATWCDEWLQPLRAHHDRSTAMTRSPGKITPSRSATGNKAMLATLPMSMPSPLGPADLQPKAAQQWNRRKLRATAASSGTEFRWTSIVHVVQAP